MKKTIREKRTISKFRICMIVFFVILYMALGIYVGISSADVSITFCKDVTAFGNGIAYIDEREEVSGVYYSDEDGEKRAVFLNHNYFASEVRTLEHLITDGKKLYASAKCYDADGSATIKLYRCDFTLGLLIKQTELPLPDGWDYQSGDQMRMIDGELYYLAEKTQQDHVTVMVCKIDKKGNFEEKETYDLPENFLCEHSVYTESGPVFMSSTSGIYIAGEEYLCDDIGVLSGFTVDNGTVNTISQANNEIISIDLETLSVCRGSVDYMTEFSTLQNIKPYSSDFFTASKEENGYLRGYCVKNGKVRIYSQAKIKNGITPFIVCSVGTLSVVFLILGMIQLLKHVIRLLTPKNRRHMRGFLGVASKITIFSAIASLAVLCGLMVNIYSKFEEDARFKTEENTFSAARETAGKVYGTSSVLQRDDSGVLQLQDDLRSCFLNADADAGIADACSYLLFMQTEDEILCLYSDEYSSTVRGEYAVTLRTLNICERAISSGMAYSFDDYLTTGKYHAAAVPVEISDTQNGAYKAVLIAVKNSYSADALTIKTYPAIFGMLLVLSVVLVLIVNVLVRISLRRIKKIRRYINGQEHSADDLMTIRGGDEIAGTAEALRSMKNGLEIYFEDIRKCNSNYGRLFPEGMVRFITDKEKELLDGSEYTVKMVVLVKFWLKEKNESEREKLRQICCDQRKGYLFWLSEDSMVFGFPDKTGEELLQNLSEDVKADDYHLIFAGESAVKASILGTRTKRPVMCGDVLKVMNRISADKYPDGSILVYGFPYRDFSDRLNNKVIPIQQTGGFAL